MHNGLFGSLAFFVVCMDSLVLAQEPRRVIQASVPEYPYMMYAAGIQGKFLVDLTVLPSGHVGDAKVLESPGKYFDSEILGRVMRWKFEPQEGSSRFTIEFVFRLLPKEAPVEDCGVFFLAPTTIEIRTIQRPPITDNR